MAAQKLMLDDGAITQEQYNNNIKSITSAYEKQSAEALNTALSEGLRAIKEVYLKEFEKLAEQLNKDLAGEFVIDPENLKDSMLVLQNVINESFENAGISSGVKKNINSFLEKLMPSADELKKMATKDQSLWKSYGDTLTSVEALKTLTGSGDQMGNAVISGVNSSDNLYNAEKAGKEIKEHILKPFNEKMSVTVPLEVQYMEKVVDQIGGKVPLRNAIPDEFAFNGGSAIGVFELNTYSGDKVTKKSNAIGTTYFGGGLTYINENGGEIIDLPTGSRIYPADKSSKMMESKPNINVNVNIGGNIYGSENAADEIGSAVCERILNMIYAL